MSFWCVTFAFHGRGPNIMLLLSSCAGIHSATPFFSLSWKGSFHFTASSHASSHWAAYQNRSCSLTQCFEMILNSQYNKTYVRSLAFFSAAKFTWQMSIKLSISYTTVFNVEFSFKLYSWYVSIAVVMAGPF